jgi:rsbT co-antagonist protein RsbR
MDSSRRIAEVLAQHETRLLDRWLALQEQKFPSRPESAERTERRRQSTAVLQALRTGAHQAPLDDREAPAWEPLREVLTRLSHSWARAGRSPSDTARFVLSFKQPLFELLLEQPEPQATLLTATTLIDELGLFTTEVHQAVREGIIARQQEEMLELSTPVVKLWDGVLALPLIGTLDSSRTQTVMESLLQRIVETGADIAIIDITGVPTVDTLTAQHLLKTVTATRLMGAECIISGIRPQIAQTLVQLGVDLGDVLTRASLASALSLALQRRRLTVVPVGRAGPESRPS